MNLLDTLLPQTPPEPRNARLVRRMPVEQDTDSPKPTGVTERVIDHLKAGDADMSKVAIDLGLTVRVASSILARLNKQGRVEVVGYIGKARIYRATGKPGRKPGRQKR